MIQRTWSELPEAREELFAETDRLPPEIADEFIESVSAAMEDILNGPESWPVVHYWNEQPELRWRRVSPFRVRIVYHIVHEEVRVIAYAHEAREPGYWRRRLETIDIMSDSELVADLKQAIAEDRAGMGTSGQELTERMAALRNRPDE